MKMNNEGMPSVFFSVFSDLSWRLTVEGIVAGQDLPVCCGHPSILTEEEFTALLGKSATLLVCIGNRDLLSVVEAKKGPEGQVPVQITASDVYWNGTIHHIMQCFLLSNKPQCDICWVHRSDLMVLARREMRKSKSVFFPGVGHTE